MSQMSLPCYHVDSCGSRGVCVALPKYFNNYNKYLIGWWLREQCTGGGGGGGYYPFFYVSQKKITERRSSEGAYARFFMRTRKKNRKGGGYTQIFGVYSKNITASVGVWGAGGIMPNFFMRTRKGGLYPNFWCVIKEYYCECGGGGLCQFYLCVLEN